VCVEKGSANPFVLDFLSVGTDKPKCDLAICGLCLFALRLIFLMTETKQSQQQREKDVLTFDEKHVSAHKCVCEGR
jgi:hypothetical protein